LKKKDITWSFAVLFAGLLVGGTVVFFVTGKDIFLRLGFVGAIVVVLLWSALLSIRIIKAELRGKRYFELATAGALHGGIVLLLIYFFWFSLSEMLGVQILGPVPPLKSSKLAILAAFLIGLSVIVLFVAAAFSRKKDSRRRDDA
jgi:hypothetical protein